MSTEKQRVIVRFVALRPASNGFWTDTKIPAKLREFNVQNIPKQGEKIKIPVAGSTWTVTADRIEYDFVGNKPPMITFGEFFGLTEFLAQINSDPEWQNAPAPDFPLKK